MNNHQIAQGGRQSGAIPTSIASGILWIVSSVLALASVFALRDILLWGVGLLVVDPNERVMANTKAAVNVSNQCGTIIFGMIALGVILYTSELIFTKASQPRTLRILIRLTIVEAVIVVPIAILFWL